MPPPAAPLQRKGLSSALSGEFLPVEGA